MITLNNVATGLTFNDWVNVLLTCEEGVELGHWDNDLVGDYGRKEYEMRCFWLEYLAATRKGPEVPIEIREGRGIGTWYAPEIVIIKERLLIPFRCVDDLRNNPRWELPNYKRLRPFNETLKALKFFYNTLIPSQATRLRTYITTIDKVWLDIPTARALFAEELKLLLPSVQKIVLLGNETYMQWITYNPFKDIPVIILPHPGPYDYNHSVYRQAFCEAVK